MKIVKLTDNITGLDFKGVINSETGAILFSGVFDETFCLRPAAGKEDCYLVPKSLFRHVEKMSARECAEYLGVTKARISKLCQTGRIKSAKIGGRLVIDAESVYSYERTKELCKKSQ